MSVGLKEFVGPYRMFHLIRAGAIFEIWAVRPVAETTPLAMKWLPTGSRYDRANVANLKHEYEVGKTLDHPSIIKTMDFGNGKDGAYLVMELFKTPNVKQQLTENIAMLHWRLDKILIDRQHAITDAEAALAVAKQAAVEVVDRAKNTAKEMLDAAKTQGEAIVKAAEVEANRMADEAKASEARALAAAEQEKEVAERVAKLANQEAAVIKRIADHKAKLLKALDG